MRVPTPASVASSFDRPSARIADLDAHHLYRRAARARDDLAVGRCEAFIDKASDHGAIKPMGQHERVLGDALRNTGQ
jgi:hypothetical protein